MKPKKAFSKEILIVGLAISTAYSCTNVENYNKMHNGIEDVIHEEASIQVSISGSNKYFKKVENDPFNDKHFAASTTYNPESEIVSLDYSFIFDKIEPTDQEEEKENSFLSIGYKATSGRENTTKPLLEFIDFTNKITTTPNIRSLKTLMFTIDIPAALAVDNRIDFRHLSNLKNLKLNIPENVMVLLSSKLIENETEISLNKTWVENDGKFCLSKKIDSVPFLIFDNSKFWNACDIMKHIYLFSMLNIDEDLDDDLLQDAIEMLV